MTRNETPAPAEALNTISAPSEPTGSLGRDSTSAPGSGDFSPDAKVVLVELVAGAHELRERRLSIVLDRGCVLHLVDDVEVAPQVWRDVLAAWSVVTEAHQPHFAARGAL